MAQWFALTVSRPTSKVTVTGQSSRSQDENSSFSATDVRYKVTYFMDARYDVIVFSVFFVNFCIKIVGVTSSQSFLLRLTDWLLIGRF